MFQLFHISFNDPNYVTLDTVMNTKTKNAAKMTKNGVTKVFQLLICGTYQKMVLTNTPCQMLQVGSVFM